MNFWQRMVWTVLALAAVLSARGTAAQQGGADEKPFPPHHVIGNVYYVGSRYVSSYLVVTKGGNILINSGFERTVPIIQAGVKKLGFRMGDIKILLTSHAHNDHVEGSALVRKLTGAKVMVMEGDEKIVRTGGQGDFQYHSRWKPCPVDRVLHDGDRVTLGETTLVAHKTPGHTRGCTTWTMTARENGKRYQVVIIGSPNVNPGYRLVNNKEYPKIASDYEQTFRVLSALPCDVFLGAHGSYYNLEEKYARLKKEPGVNPFIDSDGYHAYVSERQHAFEEELAKQRAEK